MLLGIGAGIFIAIYVALAFMVVDRIPRHTLDNMGRDIAGIYFLLTGIGIAIHSAVTVTSCGTFGTILLGAGQAMVIVALLFIGVGLLLFTIFAGGAVAMEGLEHVSHETEIGRAVTAKVDDFIEPVLPFISIGGLVIMYFGMFAWLGTLRTANCEATPLTAEQQQAIQLEKDQAEAREYLCTNLDGVNLEQFELLVGPCTPEDTDVLE